MKKTILLAAASAVALLGCASTPGPSARARPPNTDARNPEVYVFSDGTPNCADRKLMIVVEPDVLSFPNTGGQAFPIIWHMKTPGYNFAQNNNLPNPVPLKGSNPGGISGCRSGGNTMQCTNNNADKGIWKYAINGVVANDGCNPPDLDPIINND